jgi:hypothetical protein
VNAEKCIKNVAMISGKQTCGSYDIQYVKIHVLLKYYTDINIFEGQSLQHFCCDYHDTHLKLAQYHISGAVDLLEACSIML